MGQKNADTIEFKPWQNINDALNSNIHTLVDVCLLRIGDTVDILEVDLLTERIISVIASDLTILSINPGTKKVTFSGAFDANVTGTPVVKIDDIDDAQQALERAICDPAQQSGPFDLRQNIEAFEADVPSGGKARYDVDDVSLWRAGDEVKIIDDNGVVIASTTVDGIGINADDVNNKATIDVNDNTAINLGVNPYIQNLTIDQEKATKRNQERIDEIDRPLKNNEPVEQPDGEDGCFEFPALFLAGSTDVFVDGNKKTLGDKGTLSTLVQGALPNGQITFDSMILNLFGDQTRIQVQAGAGFTVAVSGQHKNGFLVQVNDNGGAATARQIAEAINGDVDAKKIIQALYSGDGSTVIAPFGPTNLAGGANDATKDYAELEQVFENSKTGTGYKFISFNIRTDQPNRMNKVPKDSEEMVVAFSKAHDNQDR